MLKAFQIVALVMDRLLEQYNGIFDTGRLYEYDVCRNMTQPYQENPARQVKTTLEAKSASHTIYYALTCCCFSAYAQLGTANYEMADTLSKARPLLPVNAGAKVNIHM